MKSVFLYIAIVALATAQAPDAFTGTWVLNAKKSTFTQKEEAFASGERSYAPTPQGTRVTWKMKSLDGEDTSGEYSVTCKSGACVSDVAEWKIKDARRVEGRILSNGKVTDSYTRAVSADGKTLTITIVKQGETKPSSIQVWERRSK